MNQNTLWSLRLGFSNNEAEKISQKGIHDFLKNSFAVPFDTSIPEFLKDSPKTSEELRQNRESYKMSSAEEKKEK